MGSCGVQRGAAGRGHWRPTGWPALKEQARREGRTRTCVDAAGFYRLPGRVKTYAPLGKTPRLTVRVTHDHLSVMGAMTPSGKLSVLVRREALNGLHTLEFLQHLLRCLGCRLLVLWDGSPIHT